VSTAATIEQAQVKLAAFQQQLKAHMDLEKGNGPLLRALSKRQELQEKRAQFLSLLHHLLNTQASLSASKVWLCVEKERELEQLSRRCELQLKQIQQQKRIRELFLKTDPSIAATSGSSRSSSARRRPDMPSSLRKDDLQISLGQLKRQAHLESIDVLTHTLTEQQKGYASLSSTYVSTLLAEHSEREEDLDWTLNLLPCLLSSSEGLQAWEKENEQRKKQTLSRYLKFKNEFKKLTEKRRMVEEKVVPECARLEEEINMLAERFHAEVEGRRQGGREWVMGQLEGLRRRVRERGRALEELEGRQVAIEEAFEERMSEGRERVGRLKREGEEWGAMREEARVFFSRALKEVRERLRNFEMRRNAELMEMEELRGMFDDLLNEEGEEEGMGEESDEEGYESGGEEEDEEEDEER